MIKSPSRKNLHLTLRVPLLNPLLLLKPLLLSPLPFFLLLSNLSALLQLAQILTTYTTVDSVTLVSFILLPIAFLWSFRTLCRYRKLRTLPDSKILPIVAFFLSVHFYVILFQINVGLDFALLNSLFVWKCGLKTVKKITSKTVIIVPVAGLLIWRLNLFYSKFIEIILFFTTVVLIIFRKNLKILKTTKAKGELVSESTKSRLEIDKNKAQQEQGDVLTSLQEAVLLFSPELKLQYSNPYLATLIPNYALLSPSQIESEVLALRQDEKSVYLKGLAFRSQTEFSHLIKAFKSKMALFSNSVTEFNDESNTSNFSRKTIKSMISGQKRMRQSWKTKVESFMERSKIKEPNFKEIPKIKLKSLHFLNKNIKYSLNSIKTIKTIPEVKSLKDILTSFIDLQWTDCNFFAKANESGRILFVSLGIVEGAILIVIKSLDRKDPLFGVWDIYEAQNKLLASMCHELRTPLNSITNMLELMDSIDDDNESLFPNSARREYLSSAILNSKLLLSSINDFLDYFSLSANIFDLKTKNFNIRRLLMECDSIFRAFSIRKMINLFLQIPDMESYICCNDEDRIKQIIVNLLNNAFKFTMAGGTIILQLKSKGDAFEIIIRDTGIGIDTTRFRSLANFQALNNNDSVGIPVLGGFGLTISNLLTNYVGPSEENGKIYKGIKLRTEKDKGSRFSFLIDKKISDFDDADSPGETNAIEHKAKNIEQFRKSHQNDCHFFNIEEDLLPITISSAIKCFCHKILAVDDNEFNLFVLSELFKKQDMEIDTSSGGVEAIHLVAEILHDTTVKFCNKCRFYKLILMDIDMPIKNGYETTKEIIEMLKHTGIEVKIVALSAFSHEDAKEKAFEAGIVDYIEKPFSPAKMTYLIGKYL